MSSPEALAELVELYRTYEESDGAISPAALESFEAQCKLQARAINQDPLKLMAFVRKRYYAQVAAEDRRNRRPVE